MHSPERLTLPLMVQSGEGATGPEAEASKRFPSGRAPVPQSSTKMPPEGVVSSTQDVLPPK